MENKLKAAFEFALRSNSKLFAENIFIPQIIGFEEINCNINNVLYLAKSNNGFLIQVISDGVLNPNEDFYARLESVLRESEKYVKEKKLSKTTKYYKDYKTNKFNFLIFSDQLSTTDKLYLELNAFFIEPSNNNFYQLNVSFGPIEVSEEYDIRDLKEQKVKELESLLILLLDNINIIEG